MAVKTAVSALGISVLGAGFAPLFYVGTRGVALLSSGALRLPAVFLYVILVCGMLGTALERIAYRPLRYKTRLSSLITALGVSLFLENFCSLDIVFSSAYRPFPPLIARQELVRIPSLGITVSSVFVVNIVTLALLLGLLWLLVQKTMTGRQMRAVAYNLRVASLMGIDVDRVIGMTFVIGSAIAGVSGILFAMNYGILQSPFLGFTPGLKAFIAAVLGGIGSLPGAVIGALVMGVTEVFANSVDSNLGFAAAFLILIVILIIRPTGIMGRRETEKV